MIPPAMPTDAFSEHVIVSDLHLGARRESHTTFDRGAAFARFLGRQAEEVRGGRTVRFVLLGDIVDLPTHGPAGISREAATAAWHTQAGDVLDAVVAAYPDVVAGLRELVDAGGVIAVVPGNHDQALVVPAVWARLTSALGDPPAGALTLHPWILYVPGVLYAEHGHQHHDLSAIPNLLRPDAREDAPGAPMGRRLEEVAAIRLNGGSVTLARAGGRLLRGLVRSSAAPRLLASARAAYRAEVLTGAAGSIGLAPEVLEAIDRRTHGTVWSIARRLVGRRLHSLRGRTPEFAGYLGPAVRKIDELLCASNMGVPTYVMGHTHTPLVTAVDGRSGPPFLANTGAWAPLRPARLARQIGPGRYPFVRVPTASSGARTSPLRASFVSVRLWNDALACEEEFPLLT